MIAIRNKKKAFAFVLALLAAVVFLLPGSFSTAKAENDGKGKMDVAVVKKAASNVQSGSVHVEFFEDAAGAVPLLADDTYNIGDKVDIDLEQDIDPDVKSVLVTVNDTEDKGYDVSIKVNGVEQWDPTAGNEQLIQCTVNDAVVAQFAFGNDESIEPPTDYGILLHYPDDTEVELAPDTLVDVVDADDLTEFDFMIYEFIDYTDPANPVHIPLVNVGTNSGAEDAEGRNPLEIQTIRRTATEWDFNIIYHSGDDPVLTNRACPAFYLTSISLVTMDNAGVEVEFHMVPDMYQSTVYSNKISIIGTTADSPAITGVYYDCPEVSVYPTGETEIDSIELGDGINPGAVTINGNTISFNSGYYASIPLKIILTNGEVGYLQLDRIGIALDLIRTVNRDWVFHGSQMGSDITTAEGSDAVNIAATYYYSADKSYEDFDVVANLTFADGHTEIKVVQGFGETENASDNSLKAGDYLVWSGASVDEAPVTVSVTAVNHGAISADTFGGALFGSGSGVTVTDLASKIRF